MATITLFAFTDATHGTELWATDGSAAGGHLVADINPGAASSSPFAFTALPNGRVLFTADDGRHGMELWVTDGNAADTYMVKDIAAGTTGSNPVALTPLADGRVLFVANDGVHGYGLWVTDGTAAGTMIYSPAQATTGTYALPPQINITSAGGLTNVASQTITGTGEAGTTVELFDGGTSLGTVTVQGDGSWSDAITLTAERSYSITATDTDSVGTSSSLPVTFTYDHTAPIPAFAVASKLTNAFAQTVAGTGEAGSTVQLYEGGVLLGTTTVASGGTWSTGVTLAGTGVHVLHATDTDLAGNTGNSTSDMTVTVDLTTPAIDITTAANRVQNVATQTITGTTLPNTTVNLYTDNGGTLVQTVTSAADGSWSVNYTFAHEGSATFTATDTSPAGNIGTSAPVSIAYDKTKPLITIDNVSNAYAYKALLSATGLTGALTAVDAAGNHIIVSGSGIISVAADGHEAHVMATFAQAPGAMITPTGAAVFDAAGNLYGLSTTGGFSNGGGAFWKLAAGASVATDLAALNVGTGSPLDGLTLENASKLIFVRGTDNLFVEPEPSLYEAYASNGQPTNNYGGWVGGVGGVEFLSGVALVSTVSGQPLLGAPLMTGGNLFEVFNGGVRSDGGYFGLSGVVDEWRTFNPAGGSKLQQTSLHDHGMYGSGALITDAAGNVYGTTLGGFQTDSNNLVGASYSNAEIYRIDTSGNYTTLVSWGASHLLGGLTMDAQGDFYVVDDFGQYGSILKFDTNANTATRIYNFTTGGTHQLASDADGNLVGYSSSGDVFSIARQALLTNQVTQTVTGTVTDAHVGTTVLIYDNGGATPIGTATLTTTGSVGTWSTTVTLSGDGTHRLTAQTADQAGNTNTTFATFNLDTTPPVLHVTSTGGLTNNPIATGTGEAGATIKVYEGASLLNSATVASNGAWSVGVPLATQGAHTVTITATDAAGNASAGAALSFTLDSIPPAVTADTVGSLTDIAAQTLAGTGETGLAVQVFDNNTLVGTTTIDGTGHWSLGVSLAAAQGLHNFVAQQTDQAGNVGTSSGVAFTYDSLAPTVTITSPSLVNQANATISGTVADAHPGSQVLVYEDGDATPVAIAALLANGTWSTTVALVGEAVAHSFFAASADTLGHVGNSGTVNVTLDITAPVVTITSAAVNTNRPVQTITGTATDLHLGATVSIYDNGSATALGTATVQADGTWSVTVNLGADGTHRLVAKDTDAAGNVGSSAAVVDALDTTPVVVSLTSPVDHASVHNILPPYLNPYNNDQILGFINAGQQDYIALGEAPSVAQDAAGNFYLTYNDTQQVVSWVQYNADFNQYTTVTNYAPGGVLKVDAQSYSVSTVATAGSSAPLVFNAYSHATFGAPSSPTVGTVVDAAGDLFGVTTDGGTYGHGVVWEIAAGTSTFTTLYSFNPTPIDFHNNQGGVGYAQPVALTIDGAGNLVGLLSAQTDSRVNGGVISNPQLFIISAGSHSFSLLPAFTGSFYDNDVAGFSLSTNNSYGSYTQHTLLSTSPTGTVTGILYALDSGAYGSPADPGLIYQLDPTTYQASVVHHFTNQEGFWPAGAVSYDAQGNIYGTTIGRYYAQPDSIAVTGPSVVIGHNALSSSNYVYSPGELYRIDAVTHAYTDLYNFNGADGQALFAPTGSYSNGSFTWTKPVANVVQDAAGDFFGATATGGANGAGTLWELYAGSHVMRVLYSASASENFYGIQSLMLDGQGHLVVEQQESYGSDLSALFYLSIDPANTNQGSPTFSGHGKAGSTISLYEAGTVIGTTQVAANGTWTTQAPVLNQGLNTVHAYDADIFGNSASTSDVTIYLDSIAPTVTITSAPVLTARASQVISGTAADLHLGTTVQLFDNGVQVGTAAIQADGTWTTTITLTTEVGNQIVAKATDTFGNTGSSAAVLDTLDTTPPGVAIATTGLVNQAPATITGTVTDLHPGSTVSVFLDGASTAAATGTVLADGTWSATLNLGAQGDHSLVAVHSDAVGNTGSSTAATVTLDTVQPAVAITSAAVLTGNAAVTITGTASDLHIGSLVALFDNGSATPLQTASIAADGSWSMTVTLAAEGSNSLVASTTDLAGNTGSSAPVLDVLDTTPPAVTITTAAPLTGTASQVVSGTSTDLHPGATVAIYDNGSAVALGTATLDALGRWSTTVTLAAEGSNSLVARATDAVDNTGSSAPVVEVLDTTPPVVAITTSGTLTGTASQVISGTSTDLHPGTTVSLYDNGSAVALGTATLDGAGNWSTTVTLAAEGSNSLVAQATDAAGNTGSSAAVTDVLDTTAPVVLITTAGVLTNQPSQLVSGTASDLHLCATVSLYDNGSGTALGTAAVQADGTWSTTVTLATAVQGTHSIVARDTDLVGNTGSSTAASFTLNTVAPSVAIGTANLLTNHPTTTLTIAGTATPNAGDLAPTGTTVTLFDGTTSIGTATVQANGSWSTAVTLSGEGTHSITAQDIDLAGSTGTSSAMLFTIDTIPPVVALTTTGSLTNQLNQTISGTGEAGTAVAVYDGASLLGTTTVLANGTWSKAVTLANVQGSHVISATDTDAATNVGTSGTTSFTLDTIAPAVTISGTSGLTNQPSQTVSGTGEAGTTLQLYDGAAAIGGQVTVAGDGTWSETITLAGQGAHGITAHDTDAAGNVGISSALPYTLDTIAPALVVSNAGGATSARSQTISGTVGAVDAGSIVHIIDNATQIGTATVNGAGGWSAVVDLTSIGAQPIAAYAYDAAGNYAITNPLNFTYTPIAIPAPVAGTATISGDIILTDAAFAASSGLTKLVLNGTGDNTVTLASNAAAAFANNVVVNASLSAGGAQIDGSALAAGTSLTATGSGNGDLIIGGAGNDVLYGGGGADTLIGGAGNDTFVIQSLAALTYPGRTIDGGTGTDNLHLTFTGAVADSAYAGVTNMEQIWLYGSGSNALTLAATAAAAFNNAVTIREAASVTSLSVDATAFGAAASINVIGTSGADTLLGGAGNDYIRGGGGADSIAAGAGNDTISFTSLADLTLAGRTADGGAGNDVLDLGFAGPITDAAFTGLSNLESINLSGSGASSITFGANTLAALGGAVILRANASVTSLVADASALGAGNTFNVIGTAGADSLTGGAGNDTLTGGAGNDTLTGGGGTDTFVVDAGSDTVRDLGFGGTDVLTIAAGATANATLGAAWAATSATSNAGTANLLAAGYNVDVSGAISTNGWSISNTGNATGVTLIGSARADALTGGAGADSLNGGSGNDTLTAGGGNDTMTGGTGLDSFVVDAGSTTITDLGNGGADVLMVAAGASATATLAGAFTATAASSNAGSATLLDSGFAVNLAATTGTAGWTVTNAGSATGVSLIGSAGNDTLVGGTGNDTLTGGPGNDQLTGGAGLDRFAATAGTTTITDLGLGGAEVLVVSAGATANATLGGAFTATAGTSNAGAASITAAGFSVNLAAATGASGWTITNAGNATGVGLTGSANADNITGGTGADTLTAAGNDTLTGGAGDDTLLVTAGSNTITDLGLGADALVVSAGASASATMGGAWTATAATSNAGTASIAAAGFAVNLAAATGANGWTVSNAASAIGTTLVGSANADTLVGGAGNDTLTGGAGIDTFLVTGGADIVTDLGYGGADVLVVSAGASASATLAAAWTATAASSNAGTASVTAAGFAVNLAAATGANGWTISNAASATGTTLVGSIKADTLVGGAGNDTLTGGLGVDTFQVTAGADVVTDLGKGGADILTVSVGASASATLAAAWTATAATSNAGTASITAAGFAVNLAAATGPNGWTVSNAASATGTTLVGSANADTLVGGAGNDTLTGGAGNDTFQVTAGSDVVTDLGKGADALVVSAGATASATLAAAWAATAATSNAGAASIATAGFSLDLSAATGANGWTASNAGNATAVSLVGSANNDTLIGGTGADTLTGGGGNDVLTGGTGIDSFLATAGTTTITDLALGGAESLTVAAGATANATLAAAWTATAASSNAGTASITAAGFNVNLSATTGTSGWSVTNAGNATGVSLTGSANADNLVGGSGNDTLFAAAGPDTLTGGLGLDTFKVTGGTGTVTDLGLGGAEILVVSAGATALVTMGASWTAMASTSNVGTTTVTANGFGVNVAAAIGSSGWTISNAASSTGAVLVGSIKADTLIGGAGNDTLTGGANSDTFLATAGSDVVTDLGNGGDVLVVSAGASVSATLAGNWTAAASSSNAGTASLLASGFNVNLAATSGASGWTVTNAGNATGISLVGSANNDTLIGGAGADTLTGGPGNDVLTGGAGADSFAATTGTTIITDLGLGGADVLVVSASASAVITMGASWTATAATSNAGTASITAAGFGVNLAAATGANGWSVSNAASATGATLVGSAKADTLIGGAGNDTLTGGAGIDTFQVTGGADIVTDLGNGGADILVVSAGASASATLAAAWTATAATSNAGTASVTAAGFTVSLAAASGPNGWTVTNAGNATGVSLVGSANNDTLIGGTGADTLTGGPGNDVLTGGTGIDTFKATAGSSTVTDLGLGGADVLVVSAGASASVTLAAAWTATAATSNASTASITAAGFGVNLAAATGANGWTVSNAASATGTTLVGSANADTLAGGAGNDTLTGGAGNDSFQVTAGSDVVTDLGNGADALAVSAGATASATLVAAWTATAATSNAGTAVLTDAGFTVSLAAATGLNGWTVTNAGNATGVSLTGSANADNLTGGTGNDTLIGGTGADTMSGGAGNDTFIFNSQAELTGATHLIDGGTGTDTLKLAFNATVTDAAFAGMSNLEQLALAGSGASSLTLGSNAAATFSNSIIVNEGASITNATVDASALGAGVSTSVFANAGVSHFLGGAGTDIFHYTDTTFLAAGRTADGGAGSNTAAIAYAAPFTVADTDFAGLGHFTSISMTGTVLAQVTLGANAVAAFTGGAVRVSVSGGGNMSLDGSALSTGFTGIGSTGNDTFIGGSGNDSFTSGGGNDLFVLTNGGLDTITGFNAATGVINLSGWAVHSFAALGPSIHAVGANTVISLDASHQVTLNSIAPAALTASDFIFS